MNERIQELAKQAGLEMCKCGCDMLTRQSAKFAELIVKEACLVLEAGKPGVDQVPAEIALDMMQKNLRAYFGVEK